MTPAIPDETLALALRLVINAGGLAVLVFGLFLPRHADRGLAVAAALFNLCTFAVLSLLSSVQFGVAAGFGLFAILALFSLRSEPIGRTEISYCFAAVTLALVSSIGGTSPGFVVVAVAGIVGGAWLFDHPRLAGGGGELRITLDRIDEAAIASPVRMRALLARRLGVRVTGFRILNVDYPNDLLHLRVHYGPPCVTDRRESAVADAST